MAACFCHRLCLLKKEFGHAWLLTKVHPCLVFSVDKAASSSPFDLMPSCLGEGVNNDTTDVSPIQMANNLIVYMALSMEKI